MVICGCTCVLKADSSDSISYILVLWPGYLDIVVDIITQETQTLSLMDGNSHSRPNTVHSGAGTRMIN